MLRELKIDKFTVFSSADLRFSKGLTICIGENSSGKSHILKLAYAILRTIGRNKPDVSKDALSRRLARHLVETFMPDGLGRLVTRRHGLNSCCVEALWGKAGKIVFRFSTRGCPR